MIIDGVEAINLVRKIQTTISFYLCERLFWEELVRDGLTKLSFSQFVKEAFFKRVNELRGVGGGAL